MKLSRILPGNYKFTSGDIDPGRYTRTRLPFVKRHLNVAQNQLLDVQDAMGSRVSSSKSMGKGRDENIISSNLHIFEGSSSVGAGNSGELQLLGSGQPNIAIDNIEGQASSSSSVGREKIENFISSNPEFLESGSRVRVGSAEELRKLKSTKLNVSIDEYGAVAYSSGFNLSSVEDLNFRELLGETYLIFGGYFVKSKSKNGESKIYRIPPTSSLSPNVLQQISGFKNGRFYGATETFLTIHGNYFFNKDYTKAAYLDSGRPVSVIYEDLGNTIYQLNDGRHMFPQPAFRACTFACEYMLLLDQGYLNRVDLEKVMKPSMNYDRRRDDPELIDSLRRYANIDPIAATFNGTREAVLEGLQGLISQHGPCILLTSGHVVMLDAIRRADDDKVLLDVREPFHGISCTIEEHPNFWLGGDAFSEQNRSQIDSGVKAIFLPKNTVVGPAKLIPATDSSAIEGFGAI